MANGTLFDVRIAGHPTLAGRPYVAYADRPLFNPDDELDDNPDTIRHAHAPRCLAAARRVARAASACATRAAVLPLLCPG